MAVPKRKVSKQRRNKRRTHYKINAPALVLCPQCHTLKMSHRVCEECGYYGGKEIIKAEAK